jgi:hypothetical protein
MGVLKQPNNWRGRSYRMLRWAPFWKRMSVSTRLPRQPNTEPNPWHSFPIFSSFSGTGSTCRVQMFKLVSRIWTTYFWLQCRCSCTKAFQSSLTWLSESVPGKHVARWFTTLDNIYCLVRHKCTAMSPLKKMHITSVRVRWISTDLVILLSTT